MSQPILYIAILVELDISYFNPNFFLGEPATKIENGEGFVKGGSATFKNVMSVVRTIYGSILSKYELTIKIYYTKIRLYPGELTPITLNVIDLNRMSDPYGIG